MASKAPVIRDEQQQEKLLRIVSRGTPSVVRTDASGNPISNRILLDIPDNEFDALQPYLQYVELPLHKSMHEAEDGIVYGYFLNTGLSSLVIAMNDGRSVEVGIVGREGFVGAPLAAGVNRTPYRALAQAAGSAVRIKAEVLEVNLPALPALRFKLNHYSQGQTLQVARLAACNRLHPIDQRLARWMLMCQDRLDEDLLPMTHDFFAEMLGSGRPSVSVAAAVLQKAGAIQYARGTVKIVDRPRLEELCCECYGVMRAYNEW
jgi:CRP-like cAMP-binding protein